MDSLAGHFLIASPAIMDPNFERAVVLITAHNDEGEWITITLWRSADDADAAAAAPGADALAASITDVVTRRYVDLGG